MPRSPASIGTWRRAATRPRSSGKATIRRVSKHVTYRELHEQVCRLANAMKGLGVKQGRPRHDLPADGAGGGGGDAGLRADRRDPFGGVRRVLPRQPGQPHPGLRLGAADHRRRGAARRPQGAAEGERRRGAEVLPGREERHRGEGDRRRGRDAGRPRPRLCDAVRGGLARLPARRDERRGPAVHPVHLGQHRQAEGRAAHHRRLHGVGQLHA